MGPDNFASSRVPSRRTRFVCRVAAIEPCPAQAKPAGAPKNTAFVDWGTVDGSNASLKCFAVPLHQGAESFAWVPKVWIVEFLQKAFHRTQGHVGDAITLKHFRVKCGTQESHFPAHAQQCLGQRHEGVDVASGTQGD